MKKNVLIFFAVVTFLGCSKKDDGSFTPTLPPITQTGENTFGCYANGILITPRDGTGTFNSPDNGMNLIAGPNSNNIEYNEIDVHDFVSQRTAKIIIHIVGLDSIGIGQYNVNESNCMDGINSPITNNIHCRIYDYNENEYKFFCSTENSGSINVTRYDNGILSGTFSCTAVNRDDPNEYIEITEGRFDINGYTLPTTKFP